MIADDTEDLPPDSGIEKFFRKKKYHLPEIPKDKFPNYTKKNLFFTNLFSTFSFFVGTPIYFLIYFLFIPIYPEARRKTILLIVINAYQGNKKNRFRINFLN